MKKDLFKVLLLGLAVLGLTPLQGGPASAEGGQVLNIAHPVLQQNWSPLQGRRTRSAAGNLLAGLHQCISTRTAS